MEHKITWWVYTTPNVLADRIRRNSFMRGSWGYDAKCSCGWDSKTGGALEREVRRQVEDHKAGY